jgi:hypothetical protein
MVTTDGPPEPSERVLGLGARYYLTKPLQVLDALRIIDTILAEKPVHAGEAPPGSAE